MGSSDLMKSVIVDRSAILPEIASQHKSKEATGLRTASNKSQMNPVTPQEFTGLSNYHQGKASHGRHASQTPFGSVVKESISSA